MLIIVEGPPSTGKSTRVEQIRHTLTEQYGADAVTVLHGGAGAITEMCGDTYVNHCLRRLEDYMPGGDEHLICDEWHWTHPAYGSLMSRTNPMVQPSLVQYVDQRLAQLGAVILYQTASLAVMQQRIDRRNPFLRVNSYRIVSNVEGLMRSYNRLSQTALTTVIPGVVSNMDNLLGAARYAEKKAAQIYRKCPLYIGPEDPAGILIDVDTTQYETLFPGNYTGPAFLHKALHMQNSGIQLGMLNAAFTTPEAFVALMIHLDNPRILALGKKASHYLADINHIAIPNHHTARRKYAAYIKEYGAMVYTALKQPLGTDLTDWNPKKDGAVSIH